MVQSVHVGLGGSDDDIGMGAAADGAEAVLGNAHCHLAHGVGAAGDGVDRVLLQFGLASDHVGNHIEHGVNGADAEAGVALFNAVHVHEHSGRRRHAAGIRAGNGDVAQAVTVGHAVQLVLHQGHEVFVVEFLLAVREILHGLEDGLELLVVKFVAHGFELGAYGVAAGMLADDEVGGITAHGLRGHDFVRLAVLQHAVLVDAGLMGEGVGSDDSLVVRNGLADSHGEQAAGRIELRADDIAFEAVVVLAHGQVHGHFLERRVAGAFAYAAQGDFGLTGAHAQGGKGVGHAQSEIVMTVNGEDGFVRTGGVLDDIFDELGKFVRLGVSHGVRQIDGRGSGADGGAAGPAEEVLVRAGGVLAGKLHIARQGSGERDGAFDHFNDLLRRLAQLVLHVQIAGGEEGVNAGIFGHADGFPAAADILFHAAGEAADLDIVPGLLRNGLDGVEISLARGRESGFDNIDAENFELMGDAQLFCVIHGAAGRLLAVTERGIKENNAI